MIGDKDIQWPGEDDTRLDPSKIDAADFILENIS